MEENFVFGRNPVKEKLKYIRKGTLFIKSGVHKSKVQDIIKKAKGKDDVEVKFLSKESFTQEFGEDLHQGVVLKVEEEYSFVVTESDFLKEIKESSSERCLITMLDGLKDIGNFGAVLRSCLLFGVDYVVLPRDNSVPVNEVVVKRSAGAATHLKIVYVTNLVRVMNVLKEDGFWIYAADIDGQNLAEGGIDSNKSVIVFGEEGRGLRPLVKKNCDITLTIPTTEKIDSLNISVSAGIILYSHFVRNSGNEEQ